MTTPHATALPRLALVGNPNCGKTALFNLLTGARQKVANYAGVTVERKAGLATLPDGRPVQVVDLPGTYSLTPATPDEQVTLDVIEGRRADEPLPDLIVAVVDATNLRMNLRLVLELQRRGRPLIVALNMADVARAHGLAIDVPALAAELGCPVVETVAIRRDGHAQLLAQLGSALAAKQAQRQPTAGALLADDGSAAALQREVRRILSVAAPSAPRNPRFQLGIDAVVMHPVAGLALLALLLFLMFQAVFSWAAVPMDAIKAALAWASDGVNAHMAEGPLRSLLVDGVIAGVGSVLVFLPQILILFGFILLLEDSGYLPRAAFLLDTLMGRVGLSGRAFIPLLSSFACAVPGVMATRTIASWKDRLATIMIAPLMTCSARLPVYALLIGAFIPARSVGPFDLRGLVLFGLYVAGVLSAVAVAWVFKRLWMKSGYQPLMLELPPYRLPSLRNFALGLWERARIFLRRVGTIIFSLTIVLWFLSSWPAPPAGATGAAIEYSAAGRIGAALEPVFAPIGFNWQISIALVPGMAAREVAVGALGTVYALSDAGAEDVADALTPVLASQWSLATALSLLAWFVFAPQCLSTLAVVRRETNSWRYPALMAGYLFGLAYVAAFATYHIAVALGAG
ncbi:ferrous iron transporter B [Aquincola tertiaricarbonis]|uniref:Ferrous iron transport protein B n=1 Tax=Aquincola tertiaricarbonis TaxID=391953 RepID=A0ABY4SH66_AQUTE|nr:ferrous iron transporter B [Aquincola tertiaricarbonis]URI11247.1 ferrous iron transporter B [Aquincola tertiaricarbonis]